MLNLWKTFGKRLIYRKVSKNLINNNQNFTTMKTEDYNRVLGSAVDKLRKDTSFVRRNYPVFWIALIMYLLCTSFSASAIFAHLNIRLSETFPVLWAAIFTGVLTAIVLGAQFMFKFVVDDWQAGVVTKGGADFAMMIFKGLLGTAGMIFAITLSWNGAAKITDHVREDKAFEKIVLISQDSIQRYYDGQIADLNARIGKQENNTYQKAITAQSNRNLSVLYGALKDMQDRKAAALADAKATNDAQLGEYKNETIENQTYARGFAGIAEGLALLCIILIGIFDDGLKKEAKELVVKVSEPF